MQILVATPIPLIAVVAAVSTYPAILRFLQTAWTCSAICKPEDLQSPLVWYKN